MNNLIYTIFGLGAFGIGGFLLFRFFSLRKVCTEQVVGTVCEIETKKSRRGTNYYPVFKYKVNGSEYEQVSAEGNGVPRFVIGERVTVFYNPGDPKKYYIGEDKFKAVLGFIFVAVGIYVIIRMVL